MSGHSSPLTQTTTGVHSMDAMLCQRETAFSQDRCILSAVSLYAQLLIGLSLYLFGHVSTPGYFSVLLSGAYLMALALLSLWLARRAAPDKSAIEWALGEKAGKALAVLLGLTFWLDGQLALYALTAVVENVLPSGSTLWVTLAIAATVALAMCGGDDFGLPRLARMLRWVLLAMLLFCAFSAFSYGDSGHLFPLLGSGMDDIAEGALWLCGCLAGACCPLLLPDARRYMAPLRERSGIFLRPLALALLAAAVTALFSAYLEPFYALARPRSLGARLMILPHVSASVASFSLFLCGLMFLMLLALATAVDRAGRLMSWAIGKPKAKPFLIFFLLLTMIPAPAQSLEKTEALLISIAPWRGAAALFVTLLLTVGALHRMRRMRPTPGKKENRP